MNKNKCSNEDLDYLTINKYNIPYIRRVFRKGR